MSPSDALATQGVRSRADVASEELPGTSPGAPGASPRGFRSTPRASSARPMRPNELPRGPNGPLGAQKTPSGGFRAVILQAFWSCFSTSAACRSSMNPSAPQVSEWPRRVTRSANNSWNKWTETMNYEVHGGLSHTPYSICDRHWRSMIPRAQESKTACTATPCLQVGMRQAWAKPQRPKAHTAW